MMDDRMDETIGGAAADYHRPPEPPREAMWEAIARARQGGGVPSAPVPATTPVAPAASVVLPFRRRAARFALPLGIAALLALAFGLGRVSVDQSGPANPAVAGREAPTVRAGEPALGTDEPPQLASGDSAAAEQTPAAAPAAASAEDRPGAGAPSPAAPMRESATPRQLQLAAGSDRAGGLEGPARGAPDRAPGAGADAGAAALAIAARQHLAQTEAFLSLFRASISAGQQIEPVVPATARHLLASNRLLIDSPAAEDPAVRRLLSDVELVLAQIAQLPADDADSTDQRLITDGIEQRDLLLRMRIAAEETPGLPNTGVL